MSNVKEILGGTPKGLPRLTGDAPRKQIGDLKAADWNQVALDMVTDSVMFFSTPTSRITNVNLAACRQLGRSRQELRRMSLTEIAPHATGGDLANQIASVRRGYVQDAYIETVYRHRDSTLLQVQCSIRALQASPRSLLVVVARSIAPHDRHTYASVPAMTRDALTGLANRDWLLQELEIATAHAPQDDHQFAVLFIDVDRFKGINDSFGHLVGDQVLQAVAGRLAANVRPGDTVARYGGDEFVVLMKNVRCAKSIAGIAARIGRRVTAAGTRPGGQPWRARVTMSIGVALCGGALCLPMAVVDCADRAMYRAKSLGRNGQFVIEDLSQSRRG